MIEQLTKEQSVEKAKRLAETMERLKLKFELKIITPSIAKRWIKKNTKNRRAEGSSRVCSYARQMAANVWGFSGQPIIISDTGLVLDGGGRLGAVISSNSPIISTVIYGVPESSFAIMDSIKARSFKDVLEASHLLDGETNTIVGYVASMAKRMTEWVNERYGSHGSSTTRNNVLNNCELLDFVEENLVKMRECAKACYELRGAHREKLMKKKDYLGSFMAYLTISKGWDFSDVYKFFDELTNIHSVVREEGNPISTLRTYLRMFYEKEIHITDEEQFHMFSRAWNNYKIGNEIKRFSLKKCKDTPMHKFEFTKNC